MEMDLTVRQTHIVIQALNDYEYEIKKAIINALFTNRTHDVGRYENFQNEIIAIKQVFEREEKKLDKTATD